MFRIFAAIAGIFQHACCSATRCSHRCAAQVQRALSEPCNTNGDFIMKKIVLALGLSAFATSAFAAGEADFAKVDANADAAVSLEEATAAGWTWTEDQFKAADKDANGSLSAEEFAAAIAA
jgi:EF hand